MMLKMSNKPDATSDYEHYILTISQCSFSFWYGHMVDERTGASASVRIVVDLSIMQSQVVMHSIN